MARVLGKGEAAGLDSVGQAFVNHTDRSGGWEDTSKVASLCLENMFRA